MNIRMLLVLLAAMVLTVGCEQLVMQPEPSTSYTAVFDEYMNVIATKYGMLEQKGLDPKALADSLRPSVRDDMSIDEFLAVLQVVVDRLNEGHCSVYRDDTTGVGYAFYLGYPQSSNVVVRINHYSSVELNPDYREFGSSQFFEIAAHRLLQDTGIAYVRIPSFSLDLSESSIDSLIDYVQGSRAMIIDVRDNLGGFVDVAFRLASRFTTTDTFIGTEYVKTGPGQADVVPSRLTLKPGTSSKIYTKPAIVLTNRITFSSGSIFSNALSALPQIRTLGQINGGGTGAITTGLLGNGWKWTMPTSHFVDYNGVSTHNGQRPDIEMVYDLTDKEHDTYIDEAIRLLQ